LFDARKSLLSAPPPLPSPKKLHQFKNLMRFKPKSLWKEMNVLIARPQLLLYNDNGEFLNLKIHLCIG
jgi:hypothetical protein